MQEADRDALYDRNGGQQPERTAWRGGSVESHVTLGGRRVKVSRLRVRDGDGEVPLASFQWAASTDALAAHTLEAIAAGVSTRQDAGTLDPVLVEVSERATSRSAVSRRFVALSTAQLPGGSSAGGWPSWTCVWSASTARSASSTASCRVEDRHIGT